MKIDIKDFSKLARGFVDIPKACITALKNTFNVQVALTRKNGIAEIERDFILRNDFSKKSIAFDKCESESIPTMQASVGALQRAEYLALQHEGGIRRSKKGSKLAIAQETARGGSRRRLVSKQFYMNKLKSKMVRGKTKRSHNFKSKKARLVAMAYVAKQNNLYVKHNNSIFAVTSFSKMRNRVKFKSKHLYNVGERTAKIKSRPWLITSAQKPAADGQAIFNSQVKKLLAQKKII